MSGFGGKKKKSSRRRDRLQRISRRFHLSFFIWRRHIFFAALRSLWSPSVDSLWCRRSDTREKHAAFDQSTVLNGLQFSLLHWDMRSVVCRLIVCVKILLKAKKWDKHWDNCGPLKEQFTISDRLNPPPDCLWEKMFYFAKLKVRLMRISLNEWLTCVQVDELRIDLTYTQKCDVWSRRHDVVNQDNPPNFCTTV